MKLWELFQDKFINTIEESKLFEMAYSRRDVERKITDLGNPIIKHLVKIFKWEDRLNYAKHCNDIESWLIDIGSIQLKNGNFPKQENYFKWICSDNLHDANSVSRLVKQLSNYHSLKEIRSNEEVYRLINELIYKISIDLAKDKFESLSDYL